MNKHFTFYEDSYYSSNGCDCCEPTQMFYYNSDDTDARLGSAHSEEDWNKPMGISCPCHKCRPFC